MSVFASRLRANARAGRAERRGKEYGSQLNTAIPMLEPSQGTVRVGRPRYSCVGFHDALAGRTGYVLQRSGCSAHERQPQRRTGADAGRVAARAGCGAHARALELVGLPPADFASRWPDQLSGDSDLTRRRARALAADLLVLMTSHSARSTR